MAVPVEQVIREYLKILKGSRTQEVLAKAMGYKVNAVSQILSGERPGRMEHVQLIADSWGVKMSDMLGDLAIIAVNLELGRPANQGVGGPIAARDAAVSGAEHDGGEAP